MSYQVRRHYWQCVGEMQTELKDGIVISFDDVLKRWPRSRRDTIDVVQALKNHYTAGTTSREDVIKGADGDRGKIKNHLKEHRSIYTKAKNTSTDLKIQLESSKNAVAKMKKHGLVAAIAFTLLGAIVGLAIGLKVPGLGLQVIAAVVAVIVGIVCCGCFAFAMYFVLCRRRKRNANMWEEVKNDNEQQQGIRLEHIVKPKKECLGEIDRLLGDIEEVDNYDTTFPELMEHIDEYLKDDKDMYDVLDD